MYGGEGGELGPSAAGRFRRPGDRVAQILCDSPQRCRSLTRGSRTDRGDDMFVAMITRSCAALRDLGTLDFFR